MAPGHSSTRDVRSVLGGTYSMIARHLHSYLCECWCNILQVSAGTGQQAVVTNAHPNSVEQQSVTWLICQRSASQQTKTSTGFYFAPSGVLLP